MPIRVNLDPSGQSQFFKYIEDGRTPDRPENYTDYTVATAPPEVLAMLNQDTVAEQSPSATWRGQGPSQPMNLPTGNNGYPTLGGGGPQQSATAAPSAQQNVQAAPSAFSNPFPGGPPTYGPPAAQASSSPGARPILRPDGTALYQPAAPAAYAGNPGFQTGKPMATFDQLMQGQNPGPPAMLTPSQGGYPDPSAAQYSPRAVAQANQGVQAQFDQFRANGISPMPVASGPMSANASLAPGQWRLSLGANPTQAQSVPGVNDLVAPPQAQPPQQPQAGQFDDPNLNAIMTWMGQKAGGQQPSAFNRNVPPAVTSGYRAPIQANVPANQVRPTVIPTVVPPFNSNPSLVWDPILNTYVPLTR